MLEQEVLEELREQTRLIKALLALRADALLRDNPELGASRHRSIELLLSEGLGLKNVEIATMLGKSPQAVGQAIARARA
jgi:DNA-directed RNA polymerase specialized sigma24 family protein